MPHSPGGRNLWASLACLSAGVLSLAAAAAPAQAAGHCVVPRSRQRHVVKVTRALVVYYVHKPESAKAGETNLYLACSRATNRFVEIGSEEPDPEYGPEDGLSDLQVQGNWLVMTQTSGAVAAAECGKYSTGSASTCPSTEQSLIVIDAAGGRKGEVRDVGVLEGADEPPLSPVLISSDGALAWLQGPEAESTTSPGTLYGCVATPLRRGLACKPREVARGVIPTASLRLTGTTLSWTVSGQPGSSVL